MLKTVLEVLEALEVLEELWRTLWRVLKGFEAYARVKPGNKVRDTDFSSAHEGGNDHENNRCQMSGMRFHE